MSRTRARLGAEARALGVEPGVYLMKDDSGAILYIGKAKSLRARVSTYFQGAPRESPRTELLVGRVSAFEVILTETESEALILECTLIKKHKPPFNVRLKDDKAYPYLRVDAREEFPRIDWTRKARRDGARYFGPFPSAWSARQVLQLLNETYRLRDCSDNTFRHRTRPCILHQMGKCSAPCVGKIGREAYADGIASALRVLEGRDDALLRSIEDSMKAAAEREEYERAAWLRDQAAHLRVVVETQGVDDAGTDRDRDAVGLARKGDVAQAALLQVRGGKLISVSHFHLQNAAILHRGEGLPAPFVDILVDGKKVERAEPARGRMVENAP